MITIFRMLLRPNVTFFYTVMLANGEHFVCNSLRVFWSKKRNFFRDEVCTFSLYLHGFLPQSKEMQVR